MTKYLWMPSAAVVTGALRFQFDSTATVVVLYVGRKTSPRTSSIMQVITYFLFVLSDQTEHMF